ncbi:unnamed protein product [Urochloa decumbens]|uniref:F-box domain-containing protein n=1 Tax=Urochloa decumbens TaxID=240449 RepID=A0ABC9AMR9_9POAL
MDKKMKASAAVGEDRISELPDALLHHVLSLLPVDEAVRTSVLARRWRGLWKGVPVLRLVGPKKRFPSAEDFDRFVNHLISVRGDLPLVSCEVEAYLTWDDYAGSLRSPSRTSTSILGSSTRWRARFRAIDLHALIRILQHTPILEELTLQLRSDENFLNAGRGERKHARIEQTFACAHLKQVNIECEEKLRVKDKVKQIVKIFRKSGILTEKISFKKIPRPQGCKLTIDVLRDSCL